MKKIIKAILGSSFVHNVLRQFGYMICVGCNLHLVKLDPGICHVCDAKMDEACAELERIEKSQNRRDLEECAMYPHGILYR